MGEVPTQKHPKWWNCTSDGKSDGRFWIGKPGFLFEFPSNHTSISRSFGDMRKWRTDRQTDSADHYYSWPPHCDGPGNKVSLADACDTWLNVPQLPIACTRVAHTCDDWPQTPFTVLSNILAEACFYQDSLNWIIHRPTGIYFKWKWR